MKWQRRIQNLIFTRTPLIAATRYVLQLFYYDLFFFLIWFFRCMQEIGAEGFDFFSCDTCEEGTLEGLLIKSLNTSYETIYKLRSAIKRYDSVKDQKKRICSDNAHLAVSFFKFLKQSINFFRTSINRWLNCCAYLIAESTNTIKGNRDGDKKNTE